MKYLFEQPLVEGVILSRPNRFIMEVEVQGRVVRCHCPSTGKIGGITFHNIPCLLSPSENPKRKTPFTVEAIYPEKGVCVGINQVKANSWLEFFFRNNILHDLVTVQELRREVKLNDSKIDFLINDTLFLEVKTPLMHLPFGDPVDPAAFNSFARTGRHYQEITARLQQGQRAVILICCMYDAEPFQTPDNIREEIRQVIASTIASGLERWQVNMQVDREGVTVTNCFKLDF